MLKQVSWIFFSLAAVADYAALPSASFTDYSALYAPDVRALWARLRPADYKHPLFRKY